MKQGTKEQEVTTQTGQVTSADGTTIGYRQMGSGPGLVILHGGGRASHHYLRLAEALADAFTVYIPDRRGRGLSGPEGADYSMAQALEDLSAVLEKTGAQMVFGHSAGAVISLEAALVLPIEKLALYEPPLLDGSFPVDWVPAFEQALASRRSFRAMGIFFKGLRLNWMSRLPLWSLILFSRLMANLDGGREMIELLPTVAADVRMAQQLDPNYHQRYGRIGAKTLLMGGGKSPAYLRHALRVLAATIPDVRLTEFPRLEHNAPDLNAPEVIARTLREFLSGNSGEQAVAADAAHGLLADGNEMTEGDTFRQR